MSGSSAGLDPGGPSERSAVIVRAHLPAGLERLRRRSVPNAAEGVPAHLTLLYPFVAPERLTRSVRSAIEAVVPRHAPFPYALAGKAIWPDTVYVAVDPVAPFLALQEDLARAFPDFPIYGEDATFEFVPHVTIAEGSAIDDGAVLGARAWASLPRPALASSLEVIARAGAAPWRTVWRIGLGGSGWADIRDRPLGRMPP